MRIRVSIASRPRLAAATLAVLGVVLAAAVAVGLGQVLSHASGAPPSSQSAPPLAMHAVRVGPSRQEHGARHRPAAARRHHAKGARRRSGGGAKRRLQSVTRAPAPVVQPVFAPPPLPSRLLLDDTATPTPTPTPAGPVSAGTPDALGPSRGTPDVAPTPTATPGSTPLPLPGDD